MMHLQNGDSMSLEFLFFFFSNHDETMRVSHRLTRTNPFFAKRLGNLFGQVGRKKNLGHYVLSLVMLCMCHTPLNKKLDNT